MPGGLPVAWMATVVCWLFIAGASVWFFVQSPTSDNPMRETWILAAETVATIVAGVRLIPRRTS